MLTSSFVGVAHLPGEEQLRMDMASATAPLPTATMSLSLAPIGEITYFENARIFHSTLNFYNVAQCMPTTSLSVPRLVCVCRKRRVAVGAFLFYSASLMSAFTIDI